MEVEIASVIPIVPIRSVDGVDEFFRKLVLQLIDIRVGPTDDDIMMINWLIDQGVPFTVVATKTDKLSKAQLKAALDKIHEEYFNGTGIEILPFSSVTREGKDLLWSKIFDAIN